MAKKLNEDQTFKFVTLYREHQCLWDITSENYKNKPMRDSAAKNICSAMEIVGYTVEDVKNKIKSIRSTYYLEVDKIKKSSTSGASGNVYKPKMKWFAELDSFIKTVIVKRKTQDNNDSTQSESESTDTAAPATYSENESRKSKSKRSKISELSSIVSNVKMLQNDMCKLDKEDEFDIFGKHVANQLRNLSTEQSIIAQEEIQSMITKCRLHDLRFQKRAFNFPSTTPAGYTSALKIQTAPSAYTLVPQISPASTSEDSLTFVDTNYEIIQNSLDIV